MGFKNSFKRTLRRIMGRLRTPDQEVGKPLRRRIKRSPLFKEAEFKNPVPRRNLTQWKETLIEN